MEQVQILIVDQATSRGALTTDEGISTNGSLLEMAFCHLPGAGRLLSIDAMLIKAWVRGRSALAPSMEEERKAPVVGP